MLGKAQGQLIFEQARATARKVIQEKSTTVEPIAVRLLERICFG
jgi:F0F1-type ATP synthase membrane subunit b/b'